MLSIELVSPQIKGVESPVVSHFSSAFTLKSLSATAYAFQVHANQTVLLAELDSSGAICQIRSIQELKQTDIIAMKGNAMHEDKRECLDLSMNTFVSKPIRIRDVHEALSQAIGV